MNSHHRSTQLISWVVLAAAIAVAHGRLTLARPVLRSVEFKDDFSSGKLDYWQLPHPEDWEVRTEGSLHYLHMKRSREPGEPRRPLQFALLKGINMSSFELQTMVRREGRSMIIVFNYVDTLHFYYVHLSEDRGTVQPVHNGIFIVDGGPRRRIAGTNAQPALPDRDWHKVRISRDGLNGEIRVFVDGSNTPLFSVKDDTFRCGKVGLGSFDETGDFADFRLKADDVDCNPGSEVRIRPAKSNP